MKSNFLLDNKISKFDLLKSYLQTFLLYCFLKHKVMFVYFYTLFSLFFLFFFYFFNTMFVCFSIPVKMKLKLQAWNSDRKFEK